jgi:hypothetical protein
MYVIDNTKRLSITGECSVTWRQGVQDSLRRRYPDAGIAASPPGADQ